MSVREVFLLGNPKLYLLLLSTSPPWSYILLQYPRKN